MSYAKPLFSAVVLASLTLVACVGAPGEVEEQVGVAEQAVQGHTCHGVLANNGLANNGLANNGLANNGLANNGLANNGLANNGLADNDLLRQQLEDPNARQLFKYIVSCALPAGQAVSVNAAGVDYSFHGDLGLAPDWGQEGGHCGEHCQQWVSACVLSRVDFLGATLQISLRGANAGLSVTGTECSAFTQREATYYGNLFTSPAQRYACLPPGKTEIPRVCGPSIQGCVVDVLGECEDLCGHVKADGSYPNCRTAEPEGEDSEGEAKKFHGSITVYLHP